jgi:hypothetical protein
LLDCGVFPARLLKKLDGLLQPVRLVLPDPLLKASGGLSEDGRGRGRKETEECKAQDGKKFHFHVGSSFRVISRRIAGNETL